MVGVKAESPPTAPTIATVSAEVNVPMFGGLGGVALLDELLAGSAGAMTGFAFPEALVATVGAWQRDGYRAAREAFIPWMPLILFEAQDKISLALRKDFCRRHVIREPQVRPPGPPMPQSMMAVLCNHLSAVEMPK